MSLKHRKYLRNVRQEDSHAMPTQLINRTESAKRRGFTIAAVLFFMFFTTALIIGTLTFSLRQQRQLARQFQAEQTAWLLDGGLIKAMDRLATNPEYQGETILIEPAINQYERAEVEIVVTEESEFERYRIRVTAILAAAEGAESTVRRSIEVFSRPRQ